MIFIVGYSIHIQSQYNLNQILLSLDDQNYSENDRSDDNAIHFYGMTTSTYTTSKMSVLPIVRVSVVNSSKDLIMGSSYDLGYYDLPLKQNNKYTIYYEYRGMYAEFMELSKFINTNLFKKLEYLLPARIIMSRNENTKIEAFYRESPIEKAYWEPTSQMFFKDKNYSDSHKVEINRLQREH